MIKFIKNIKILLLLFITNVIQAQTCTSEIYISQANQLKKVDTSTNPFSFINIGSENSFNYNSIGFNPLDGFIYGLKATNATTTTDLLKINPTTGVVTTLGNVSGLPNANYINGEIDNLGNFYVMKGSFGNELYKINISTLKATKITLSTNVYSADIGFNPMNGLLYGVNSNSNDPINKGKLYTINPSNGIVNFIGNTTYSDPPFGGLMGVNSGELYGIRNDGGFYQFNILTGERTLISTAPESQNNDGAHCVSSPLIFGADLYVTKTDGKTNYTPGTTNIYTIVVGNKGPFGVQGASVTDVIPTGIPTANMTYTASVSGNATTNVSGNQIGAINDLVDLPVNGKVTYTVSINIPYSYTGNLINTVTITPPASSTYDTDLSNNKATDIDITNVCYKGPNTSTPSGYTNVGITTQQKQNYWPENIPNGWIALESKEKGFVISRLTHVGGTNGTPISTDSILDPKEGMIVYDITDQCVKLYNGIVWNCIQKSCNE